MSDERPSKRRLSIPVLLALIVLSQFVIANEMRFQGCVSNQIQLAQILIAEDATTRRADFECSRVPLI